MSETDIRFKRGSTYKVSNYTDAKKGEPVYNFETRKLYIGANDLGTLIPVDSNYSKGYEYICTSPQSVFYIVPQDNIDSLVYLNGVKVPTSDYDLNSDNITLHTPTIINDVVHIEIFDKITDKSTEFTVGPGGQTVFVLPYELPAGTRVDVYVNDILTSKTEYTFDLVSIVTFNNLVAKDSIVKINSFAPTSDIWAGISQDFTAIIGNKYIVNTASNAISVTLPSTAKNGESIKFADGYDFSVHNLTLLRNGTTIEGLTEDMIVDIKNSTIELTFYDNDWRITYIQSSTAASIVSDIWIWLTDDFAVVINNKYIVDTSANVVNITLPSAPPNGSSIKFADGYDFSINNLTILRNGNTIEGESEDMIVDVKYSTFELTFYNNDWIITSI